MEDSLDSLRRSDENPNHDIEGSILGAIKPGGLSVFKCAVFIVAQMAGSGILALPAAFAGTGWTGIVILTVICLLALYCGIVLSKCWILIKEKYTIEGHVRDPYPLIGEYAVGNTGKYIVEVCIMLTLFGTSVVYLLLSSQQISSILNVRIACFDTLQKEHRGWIVICGGVLIPFTWLASPKDMPLVGYAASLCTIVSCILIVIRMSMKIYFDGRVAESAIVDVKSFFNSFGTFVFAFGGALLFPTIQTDMKEPKKFSYSASQGFLFVYILYIPVSVLPYIGIGNGIDSNILITLKKLDGKAGKTMMQIAEMLMTFHLLFATIIILNPVSQQIEEHFGIAHRFGWKRVAIRTTLMLLSIGTAEAYPNFDTILTIMGASTVNILCFILPAFFYLKLQDSILIPLHQKVFHAEIILMSVLFGVVGLYSSIKKN